MSDLLDRPLQQYDGPCDEIAFLEREANGLPTLSAELVETIRLESLGTLLERTSLLERNYEVLPLRHACTVAPCLPRRQSRRSPECWPARDEARAAGWLTGVLRILDGRPFIDEGAKR